MNPRSRGAAQSDLLLIGLGAVGLCALLIALGVGFTRSTAPATPAAPRGESNTRQTAEGRHVWLNQANRWLYGFIDNDGNARCLILGIDLPAVSADRVLQGNLVIPSPVAGSPDLRIPLDDPDAVRLVTSAGVKPVRFRPRPLQLGAFLDAIVSGQINNINLSVIDNEESAIQFLRIFVTTTPVK
jgi:hypothetical protein